MPKTVISIDDGRRQTTVNDLVANPELVPTRFIENVRNQFVAETILSNGGKANTMDFSFERNTQRYVDADPENIAEFAEFPLVHPTTGERIDGRAAKFGYRIVASREMKDYNRVDQLNKSIRQAKNRFIRWNDKLLWDALNAAPIPEIAASVAWNQQGADPRYDISKAMDTVMGGNVQATGEDLDDFDPDTILFNKGITSDLIGSDKWNEIYRGNIADKSIRYTGVIDAKPMGLDALATRTLRRDRVLVLQRGVTGFYKDPRPLEATAFLGEGDALGGNCETYASRVSQIRFIGIDEPFSACWITGVMS